MGRKRGFLVSMLTRIRLLAVTVSMALTLTLLYQVFVLTSSGTDELPMVSYRAGNFRKLQYTELLSHAQVNTSEPKSMNIAVSDFTAEEQQPSPTTSPVGLHTVYNTDQRRGGFDRSENDTSTQVEQSKKGLSLDLPASVPSPASTTDHYTGQDSRRDHSHEQIAQNALAATASTASFSMGRTFPASNIITTGGNTQLYTAKDIHEAIGPTREDPRTDNLHGAGSVQVIVKPKSPSGLPPTSETIPPATTSLPISDSDQKRQSRGYQGQVPRESSPYLEQRSLQAKQSNLQHRTLHYKTRRSSTNTQSQSQALQRNQSPTTVLPQSNTQPSSRSSNFFSIPFMGNYNCQTPNCLEFLTRTDQVYYAQCLAKVLHRHQASPLAPAGCHFMDGRNRAAVALASFPGSGNTWLRGLLEQATGICTGAIYGDVSIRMAGYIGEGVRSGAVIAVKTHKQGAIWTDINSPGNIGKNPKYGSAILLIRNPLDALIAEWNREMSMQVQDLHQNGSTHVKSVGKQFFGENRTWNIFVKTKIKKWQEYFVGWLLHSQGHPVLVVRFEDLKADAVKEMRRMLNFLKVPYSEDELLERMTKDVGTFHRKHHEIFEHFTHQQRDLVLASIRQVIELLRQHNRGDTLQIEEYLRSTTI